MISVITINDRTGSPVTLHNDSLGSSVAATAISGLVGGVVSAPRDNKSTKPQAHGAINNTKYTDGDTISLTIEIMGSSQENALATYRTIAGALGQTLDYGPALLKWTEGTTGLQLQRLVKLDSDLDPPLSGGSNVLTFQVSLFAEDPRAYNQTATTVTSSAVATLLANGTFASDAVNANPASWSVTGGSFSTWSVQSVSYASYTKGLNLIQTLGAGGQSILTSAKFAVTAGLDYSAALNWRGSFSQVQTAGGGILLWLNYYNAGGTLLASYQVDNIYLPATSEPNISQDVYSDRILAGHAVAPATATQASISILFQNNNAASSVHSGYVFAVTCCQTPSITATNNGERDTPTVITVNPLAGTGALINATTGTTLNLNNRHWELYPSGADSLTVDYAARTIIQATGVGLANPTGSALPILAPASSWGNLQSGANTLEAVGLLIGATFSATWRDAY